MAKPFCKLLAKAEIPGFCFNGLLYGFGTQILTWKYHHSIYTIRVSGPLEYLRLPVYDTEVNRAPVLSRNW